MKILAVADEEESFLWSGQVKDYAGDVDVIISCGDLSCDYLDFLVSMLNVPLIYVFGNHDKSAPAGGICIDGKIFTFNGTNILGLGGSIRYRDGVNMYTETEMKRRILKLKIPLWLKGFDILVTHAPARGFGDLDDFPHWGFESFNNLMRNYQPRLMLHGHVHKRYKRMPSEIIHPSGTRIINVCGHKIISV
ncbi:MAG: metallophosphoesterase [Synergistaceae bacterium]|nr:metallophosphoesterase [Synergistaceae bacterium]